MVNLDVNHHKVHLHKGKKTLYIIRHGETDFNRNNIVQGSGVDTHLNDLGLTQAQQFFQAFQDFPFQKIYTSALQRSIQSVQGFINLGIPHEKFSELNEIGWGDFEGKEQTAEQREHYWHIVNRWKTGDGHAKIPNGESPFELQERQRRVLEHILNQPDEHVVLICMHGRALKSFICLLLGHPISKMEEFPHTNLGLYVVEIEDGKASLVVRNDATHLEN